jgi:hypothetical protein
MVVNTQNNNTSFGFVPLDGVGLTTWVSAGGSPPAGNKFDYYRDAGDTVEVIYFCSTAGTLKKVDLKASNAVTTISLPPTIACSTSGGGVKYLPHRNSLLFIFRQNGLLGIAERPAP